MYRCRHAEETVPTCCCSCCGRCSMCPAWARLPGGPPSWTAWQRSWRRAGPPPFTMTTSSSPRKSSTTWVRAGYRTEHEKAPDTAVPVGKTSSRKITEVIQLCHSPQIALTVDGWPVSLPLDRPSQVRISAGAYPQCGLRGGKLHCYTVQLMK